MAGQPWMKLWVADIQTDGGYRRCTAFGKALWFQAICEMHTEDTYQIRGTIEELSLALALPVGHIKAGIAELKKYNVAEIEGDISGTVSLLSRRRLSTVSDREYQRLKKQRQRKGSKEKDVSPACPPNVPLSDSDSDSNNKRKVSKFKVPTLDEATEYFLGKDSSALEAAAFRDYYESKGWRVGNSPMKKWKAAASGWVRKSRQFSRADTTAPRPSKRCSTCGTTAGIIDSLGSKRYCQKCYPLSTATT